MPTSPCISRLNVHHVTIIMKMLCVFILYTQTVCLNKVYRKDVEEFLFPNRETVETSGSHCDEYQDGCLLGCYT
jgi:hypothetical protein